MGNEAVKIAELRKAARKGIGTDDPSLLIDVLKPCSDAGCLSDAKKGFKKCGGLECATLADAMRTGKPQSKRDFTVGDRIEAITPSKDHHVRGVILQTGDDGSDTAGGLYVSVDRFRRKDDKRWRPLRPSDKWKLWVSARKAFVIEQNSLSELGKALQNGWMRVATGRICDRCGKRPSRMTGGTKVSFRVCVPCGSKGVP